MLTELALATSILLSSMFPSVESYQGEDMSDEDFEYFADMHYDKIVKLRDFARNHEDAFLKGITAASITYAVTYTGPKNKLLKAIAAGASSEVVKNIYTDLRGKNEKDLEKKVDYLLKKVEEIENKGCSHYSVLDFNQASGGVEVPGFIDQKDFEKVRDTEKRFHMNDNSRGHRDRKETPSERRRERMRDPAGHERRERERDMEIGGAEYDYA